jgi:serine/threonine protein phosphatase PrpC
MARERGGEDNITVIVARFNGDALSEPCLKMSPGLLTRRWNLRGGVPFGHGGDETNRLVSS